MSDIELIEAAMETERALVERTSNNESRSDPVAELGTRLATGREAPTAQCLNRSGERSGGEGGIARGRGRPLVLRFAPDRRVRAAASKNRSAIFVEPSGFVHTPRTPKIKKGLKTGPFIFWRRGWDSNPRAGITRPSDFESAPL